MLELDLSDFLRRLSQSEQAARSGRIYTRAKDYLGNKAVAKAKRLTPVKSGLLRRSWRFIPARKGVVVLNSVEYAPYVNYGHRLVKGGRTTGMVAGRHMLEKSLEETRRADMPKALKDLRKELGM